MINTKTAPRRDVHFRTIEDVAADLDRVESAPAAGTLTTTGNWTPGQICEHVAILMECAVDGFPSKAPAPIRWLITALYKKKALSGKPMPAGFKIPNQAAFLRPGDQTSDADGIARLRRIIGRVHAGERFTHPSPVFGKLTHDQWVTLQSGHAGMHMSFLKLS